MHSGCNKFVQVSTTAAAPYTFAVQSCSRCDGVKISRKSLYNSEIASLLESRAYTESEVDNFDLSSDDEYVPFENNSDTDDSCEELSDVDITLLEDTAKSLQSSEYHPVQAGSSTTEGKGNH